MHSFQHIAAPFRLYQGAESLLQLPRELERLGCRRAVLFCGASVARGTVLALVQGSLGARGAGVFDGVRAHSPLDAVQAGAQALVQHGADAVVAVGGGSAIVTARAAAIVAA
jgi:alcohol dehydrogenase class IV